MLTLCSSCPRGCSSVSCDPCHLYLDLYRGLDPGPYTYLCPDLSAPSPARGLLDLFPFLSPSLFPSLDLGRDLVLVRRAARVLLVVRAHGHVTR